MAEQRPHDIKALEDLSNDVSGYVRKIVTNVFEGVAASAGIDPEKILHKAAKDDLKKKIQGLQKKLKGLIGRRLPSPERPFTIKGKPIYKQNGQPYSQTEWRALETQLVNYMRPYMDSVHEEMVVKAMLLAIASAAQESQGANRLAKDKQPYEQIERQAFAGYIPDSIRSMDERYQINRDQRRVVNQSLMRTAQYVQQVQDDVRDSIRRQVEYAYRNNLSSSQLASNLYWQAENVPELEKYTVRGIWRDWDRVARTELAMVHEDARQATYEYQARESMEDPEKAVYFVFHGLARCDQCKKFLGTIVRLMPSDQIRGAPVSDEVSMFGIEDPHTDIATWPGKSNFGRAQKSWQVCIPLHPQCTCTWMRIDPAVQEYNEKTRNVQLKKDEQFLGFEKVPAMQDTERLAAELVRRREESQADRMKEVHKREVDYTAGGSHPGGFDTAGRKIVERNGTRYVEVSANEANQMLDQWRRDRAQPVPVSLGTKDHTRIFGT